MWAEIAVIHSRLTDPAVRFLFTPPSVRALTSCLISAMSFLLVGCGAAYQTGSQGAVSATGGPRATDSELLSESETGPAALWENSVPGSIVWTSALVTAINNEGGNLLNTNISDIAQFCDNYGNLTSNSDKVDVWVRIISSMANEESGFRTDAYHRESVSESNPSPGVSLGLMQLSRKSGDVDIYNCGFQSDDDVRDPAKNLTCAVRILNYWVGQDKRLAGTGGAQKWRGGARYFGVLRTAGDLAKTENRTQRLAQCRAGYSSN